jgi:hypothetical protein
LPPLFNGGACRMPIITDEVYSQEYARQIRNLSNRGRSACWSPHANVELHHQCLFFNGRIVRFILRRIRVV